jgi:hypothetical protein
LFEVLQMAWRVIDTDGETWNVQAAAERRADNRLWQLSVSFRSRDSQRADGAIWATYPLEAASKSCLFQAADRISDDALKDLLVQKIG